MSQNSRDDAAALSLIAEIDNLPLTRMHVWVLLACCAGFSFDLAEIAFGNIISAVFSVPPHSVSSGQLSWLLAAVYIGAAIGAPLLGFFTDRYGRRKMLFYVMTLLAVVSVFAGASHGINDLIFWRLLAGLSLGAYPPLMFAYLTDILPPKPRGPLIVTATAIGYLGPPGLIFLVRALTPVSPFGLEAWRWGFFAAAAGAAVCALAFWRLPESPRWLVGIGRLTEAKLIIAKMKRSAIVVRATGMKANRSIVGSPVPASFQSLTRQALFLVPLYFLTPWATVGFTLLSGAVLVQKGINLQDSLMFVGIATFGPIVGTLGLGFLVDRVGRRTFLAATAIGMGLVGLLFGGSESSLGLIGTAVAFNVLVSMFMPVLVLYASEGAATENRAKLTAWAWTANRVGSAVVPLALLPILHDYGPLSMFIVIAGTLALFVAVLVTCGPKGEAGREVR